MLKTALTLVVIASVNSTIGNILLMVSREKLVPGHSNFSGYLSPWFIGALFFYGVNVIVFAKALDYLPVNIGYPILAACSFIMLNVTSWIFFGDKLTLIQLIGLSITILGIFLLSHKPLV